MAKGKRSILLDAAIYHGYVGTPFGEVKMELDGVGLICSLLRYVYMCMGLCADAYRFLDFIAIDSKLKFFEIFEP